MNLTEEQRQIHLRALAISNRYKRNEALMIAVLQDVNRTKLFKKLNQANLYQYAVNILGLTEAVAACFNSVARKAAQIPLLNLAIQQRRLSVPKASRILSALNEDNADHLVEFAIKHTSRETDFEVARLNPKARSPNRVKVLSEDLVELRVSVPKDVFQKLERAQSLLSSKKSAHVDLAAAVGDLVQDFLERHDPVKKAERSSKKAPTEPKLCTNRVSKRPKRQPLTAAQKHAVFLRDGGRCTHMDSHGNRCTTDRWLQIHHIVLVSEGGTNDPSNLTTLCSFHHDLAHQLDLPIPGLTG